MDLVDDRLRMRCVELSVIIVNWNTRELLAGCLESVLATTHGLNYEMLVVDNASSDGSAEMVRQRFPQVRLIENDRNVGFAKANNQAIQVSSGRYVLLLNSDTRVHPGALQTLVTFMDRQAGCGAAGAALLNGDGSLQESCQPTPTPLREAWRLFHLDRLWSLSRYEMQHWDSERPRPVDVLQGACLMLRRQALDEVGLLDEDYFMYSEEVDLCYRLRRAGWQVWWVPGARVTHYGGQSSRQASSAMFLQLYRSKCLFFKKAYGRRAALAFKLLLAGASLARLVLSPLALGLASPRRAQLLDKARLYRQLLVQLPGM